MLYNYITLRLHKQYILMETSLEDRKNNLYNCIINKINESVWIKAVSAEDYISRIFDDYSEFTQQQRKSIEQIDESKFMFAELLVKHFADIYCSNTEGYDDFQYFFFDHDEIVLKIK